MSIVTPSIPRRSLHLLLIAALIVSFAGALFPAQSVEASGYCNQYHTVRYGENLFRIGLLYGVSWRHLQAINGLPNANWIYAGQVLCVSSGGYYPPPPPPPPTCRAYYHVRYGDTLGSIARWYGVNVYALAQANGIHNVNRIYAGQHLCIP